MIFDPARPDASVPPEPADPAATSPRLPQCPRHGFDRPGAECYGDAGCPEWEQCRDCLGLGRDRDFPEHACATCDGSGEVKVIIAIERLVPRVVDVELPEQDCPQCHGSRIYAPSAMFLSAPEPCPMCNGAGST